jgi:hypothetical protein
MQFSENENVYVGDLIDLSNSTYCVSCSAGDGCDCDGDVDECIRGGQD